MLNQPFQNWEKILRNRTLGMETRLRVRHCYIYPVLTYGSEAWSITSDLTKRLESCEMWFLRFLGHVIKKDGLENLALTGKIEEKRGRGRKRTLWMTSLNAWIAERGNQTSK